MTGLWNEGNSTERPLNEELLRTLRVNWDTLTELINLDSGIVSKLYAKECISRRQKEFIEAGTDYTNRSERLLQIMSRKCIANFNHFVDSLSETKQGHIAEILLNGNSG